MRKFLLLIVLLFALLACVLPGGAVPEVPPLPTFDESGLGTTIAGTAIAAQTQTAISLPTSTNTPTPTHTPSITPTSTPTFIFLLSTSTPIPTYTLPPTVGTIATPGSGGVIDDNNDGVPDKKDPKTMTGKEWTCSTLGAYPPRNTVFKPGAHFHVEWTIFNSGTKSWPYYGVDLVYQGGYRNEDTKIQDFTVSVPSGGEVKVGASFIAPKVAGQYQTFFHLMVGKRNFCGIKYTFFVEESKK